MSGLREVTVFRHPQGHASGMLGTGQEVGKQGPAQSLRSQHTLWASMLVGVVIHGYSWGAESTDS